MNSHIFSSLFYKKWSLAALSMVVFLFASQSSHAQEASASKDESPISAPAPVVSEAMSTEPSKSGPSKSESSVTDQVNAVEVPEAKVIDTFDSLEQELVSAKLKKVAGIVERMQTIDADKSLPLFESLVAGELYYRRADKALFRAVSDGAGKYQLLDYVTSEKKDLVEKSVIKKVRTNNKLRKGLRSRIASLTLFSKDPAQRLSSVTNMMNNLNSDNVALLKKAQLTEKNSDVINIIKQALALANLSSDDANVRLNALDGLKDSLQPAVKNKLDQMITETSEGVFAEPDAAVLAAAQKTAAAIAGKVEMYGYLERIFFGLSLGSILLLVAAGLAITFGVMGVINMAHGELIMIGAYTTYVIQLMMPNHIAASIFVAIPAAFLVSAFFGILIERGVIQFLKGRPLETLLATFGVSLILQQLVRSVFSPLNRQVVTPEFMSGSLQINPVFALTYNRIYILLFALVVFFMLLLILKRTSLGLYVRAVSQNRNMAKAMGIRSEWVDAMTFGLGSGIAGLAGVALSQITNVGPNLGQSYIIDSFMVVVFGGVGNLWGTLVGAFALGSFNKFLEPATGAVLANIIVLVGIILFIQKKPRGLFPQKGRAAE